MLLKIAEDGDDADRAQIDNVEQDEGDGVDDLREDGGRASEADLTISQVKVQDQTDNDQGGCQGQKEPELKGRWLQWKSVSSEEDRPALYLWVKGH